MAETLKRDIYRIGYNLKQVVFPNPYREDITRALRDWDLWGPFFFIIFLALTLSWSAPNKVWCLNDSTRVTRSWCTSYLRGVEEVWKSGNN